MLKNRCVQSTRTQHPDRTAMTSMQQHSYSKSHVHLTCSKVNISTSMSRLQSYESISVPQHKSPPHPKVGKAKQSTSTPNLYQHPHKFLQTSDPRTPRKYASLGHQLPIKPTGQVEHDQLPRRTRRDPKKTREPG